MVKVEVVVVMVMSITPTLTVAMLIRPPSMCATLNSQAILVGKAFRQATNATYVDKDT